MCFVSGNGNEDGTFGRHYQPTNQYTFTFKWFWK